MASRSTYSRDVDIYENIAYGSHIRSQGDVDIAATDGGLDIVAAKSTACPPATI